VPAVDVFLDTSVLPGDPAYAKQEFEHLIQLVEARLLNVHLSDVARREWVTRMQANFAERAKDAVRHVSSLTRHRLLSELAHADQLRGLAEVREELIENARTVSGQCCERLLERLQTTVHPVRPEDGAVVLDGYFAGTPPFSDVKARMDFPDAFILQALKHLATLGLREVQGVTADARLGKSFSAIDRVTHFESIKDLLASSVIQAANEILPLAKLWSPERESDVLAELQTRTEYLTSTLQSLAENELFQNTASGNIPEDNGEATITGIGKLENLQFSWVDRDDLGPGWIGVPFSFECEAELDFMIYRADSLHAPDWVHVDFGDFEEDHYFEASGCRTVQVQGLLTIRFTLEELEETVLPDPVDVEVYEFDSINIKDDGEWYG